MTKEITTTGGKMVFAPGLNENEKSIVLARQSKYIGELKMESIIERLIKVWSESILKLGLKDNSPAEIFTNCDLLAKDLKTEHNFVKIDEVIIAIKDGVKGKFKKDGEFVFLSVANALKWVKQYQTTKHDVLSKQYEFERKKESEEMEEKKQSESVKKYWSELPGRIAEQLDRTEDEKPSPMSSIWFDNLWSMKLIQLTVEERKEIRERAEMETRESFRAKRVNFRKVGDLLHTTARKRAKEIGFYEWLDKQGNKEEVKELIKKAIETK